MSSDELRTNIIKSAATSALGVLSLLLILLGVLVYCYFQSASIRVRIASCLAMFCGVLLYGFCLLREPPPIYAETRPASVLPEQIIRGRVLSDQGEAVDSASVSSLDAAAPVSTNSAGIFNLTVRMPLGQTTVLRLSKAGYTQKSVTVSPAFTHEIQIHLSTTAASDARSTPTSLLEGQSSIIRFKYDCWSDNEHQHTNSTREIRLGRETTTVVFVHANDTGKWACGVSVNPDRGFSGFIWRDNGAHRADGNRVISGRSEVSFDHYHMVVELVP